MTFWQSVFSVFIGTVFGFIFSIVLFYITNIWRSKKAKEALEKSLIKEFEYNISFFRQLIEKLNKSIEKISSDDTELHFFLNYVYYQRLFLQSYFQQGYLYDKLDPDDIILLDNILNHISVYGGDYINNNIQLWEEGQITKQKANQVLGYERDTMEKFLKNIQTTKEKIPRTKKT